MKQHKSLKIDDPFSFFKALLSIIDEIEKKNIFKDVIDPKKVKDSISHHSKIFEGNLQQDAHEFLTDGLQYLEEELQKAHKQNLVKAVEDKTELPIITLLESQNRIQTISNENETQDDEEILYLKKSTKVEHPETNNTTFECEDQTNVSTSLVKTTKFEKVVAQTVEDHWKDPISDIFNFVISHKIICKSCEQESNVNEVYRDLSIDLPQGSSRLENFFKLQFERKNPKKKHIVLLPSPNF